MSDGLVRIVLPWHSMWDENVQNNAEQQNIPFPYALKGAGRLGFSCLSNRTYVYL